MRAWSNTAIHLEGEGISARVMHNHLHHNRRYSMGYGVATYSLGIDRGAVPIIEGNLFDWNRHAIATAGQAFDYYIARGNLVGDNATHYPFDVHEEGGGAGEGFLIEENSFYTGNGLGEVHLQDTPRFKAVVRRNLFGMHDRTSSVGYTCPNPSVVSTAELQPGDSCAVSQTYPDSHFTDFDAIFKRDNRHRDYPTGCAVMSCTENWECGLGICAASTCECP